MGGKTRREQGGKFAASSTLPRSKAKNSSFMDYILNFLEPNVNDESQLSTENEEMEDGPESGMWRRNVGLLVVCIIVSNLSGQMWNHMRYAAVYGDRGHYLVSGRRNQCRVETFIVAIAYLITTAAFIRLLSGEIFKSRIALSEKCKCYLSLISIVIVALVLMSFTNEKLGNYPMLQQALVMFPTLISIGVIIGRAYKTIRDQVTALRTKK